MRTAMRTAAWIAGLLLAGAAQAADEPAPASFAWRATLDTAGQGGLVRLPLPGEALARLQSRSAADLRVFDGQGQPVPFALAKPPQPGEQRRQETQAYRALPLYAAQPGGRLPRGMVQLRVDEKGEQRSLWVQLGQDGTQPAPGARRLQAALFDTRAQKDPVSGFVLKARIPDNVPLQFTLSTSSDLANWTPVTTQGRVFRFEGEGAPANDRLELALPLRLQDKYLRVDWSGQDGVALDAVVGLLSAPAPERELPGVALPAPVADGPSALEWALPFATPMARLELTSSRANTLLPLRILGRNQPSEPWRLLAHAVVYRLGAAGQESRNKSAVLAQASARWLRIEATHGARLEGVPLTARVLFEPLDLVFPAGAATPYQLAAGRAATPSTALPIATLATATTQPVHELPLVKIAAVQSAPAPAAGWWSPYLPRGVDQRTATLWLVLLAGVLLLGGVAWALLRQVNAQRAEG
jgi:hypothetical protein